MRSASATSGSDKLREVVRLPQGEDRNEWIAVNGKIFIFAFVPTSVQFWSIWANYSRMLSEYDADMWKYVSINYEKFVKYYISYKRKQRLSAF